MTLNNLSAEDAWEAPGQAARRVSVTTKTLQRWYETGLLTGIVLPTGHRRYLRADIDRILENRERAS